MNIDKRQQLLTILAITAVALWAGDKLVLSPLTRSWKERAARIVELRKSVAQGAQLMKREQSIHSRWEGMRTNTLSNEVSVAENQVLKAIDRWKLASGIDITSLKPQWKHNADDYMTLECRIDANGRLSTLTSFLYNVERDPLAIKVDSVDISTRDNNGQQLTLGLQVSGLLLNPPEQ